MKEKWWSVLFGATMFACGALFVVAPFMGWWLPDGVSSHSWEIDKLFYWILGVTGFFFVLTEAILVAFMYLYCQREPGQALTPSPFWPLFKPLYSVFNTAAKIEMAWTVVPAFILVVLAFAQVSTWADVKYKSRLEANILSSTAPTPVQVELSARQFEWRFRYPSPGTWKRWATDPKKVELSENWVRNPEFDDIHVTNELHGFLDRHVVVQLSTKDVIHSFNIPFMRVKQDALPGKIIPVWFKPIKSNVTKIKNSEGKVVRWEYGGGMDPDTGKPEDRALAWEIACAELCGWGHYRMIGRVYIHESEADFVEWLQSVAVHDNDYGARTGKK